MTRSSIELIFRALNGASARYLVAGGLAVVAHGYLRFTADIDLIFDLEDEAALRSALEAFSALGYQPRAPVALQDFADASLRRSWIEDKGMKVFSLHSVSHQATEIDIFAVAPFPFAPAHEAALIQEVAPGVEARFVDLQRLLAMKREAGRDRDLADLAALERLREGADER
ncbi:MAG: hypothetical protein CO113_10170 [Elusimicrobia bacterium CG_4_9_14_3_um_filter_62_55]|nr:MAG: hypothetical protein COR54_12225 [Elusimicrobia bacterium CG22_combo_CG10-13_8_21_14_all_63_91]PJA17846.1 MAG: hypothetical protein COX66_03120 [Elusimicrobia bacterium CG_4_10_14_0_2_um_filter_63_34]PJB25145.1 MAG: hypothetical protein CO113_10170 [Elusimicrobia bacterium CG_4_9_14_3_um_filter_62_55]